MNPERPLLTFQSHHPKRLSLILVLILGLILLGCSSRGFSINDPSNRNQNNPVLEVSDPSQDSENVAIDPDGNVDVGDLISALEAEGFSSEEIRDHLDVLIDDLPSSCLGLMELMSTLKISQEEKSAQQPSRETDSDESSSESSHIIAPVPALEAFSEDCTYTALINVNCRESDYLDAPITAILMMGDQAQIIAINPYFTQGKFKLPNLQQCWIYLELMDSPPDPVNTCQITIVSAPLPVINQNNDQPNPKACSKDLGQSACLAAGGTWEDPDTPAPYCDCP